jgi:hypothetical protein
MSRFGNLADRPKDGTGGNQVEIPAKCAAADYCACGGDDANAAQPHRPQGHRRLLLA